jgi:hypothetical protein
MTIVVVVISMTITTIMHDEDWRRTKHGGDDG